MSLQIATPRLRLIAATSELLRAELSDRNRWSAMLNADIPPDWPPEHWDEPAMRFTIDHMLASEGDVGWGPWYMLRPDDGSRTVIGTAGFKGHPSAEGTIEIGYGVVASCRGHGYATEASRAVIEWACRTANVRSIIAETYPQLQPSIRVMEKLGMKLIGQGSEPGVIRYGLKRDAFESAPGSPCRSAPAPALRQSPQRDSPGPP